MVNSILNNFPGDISAEKFSVKDKEKRITIYPIIFENKLALIFIKEAKKYLVIPFETKMNCGIKNRMAFNCFEFIGCSNTYFNVIKKQFAPIIKTKITSNFFGKWNNTEYYESLSINSLQNYTKVSFEWIYSDKTLPDLIRRLNNEKIVIKK